jgi:hypothetical protein
MEKFMQIEKLLPTILLAVILVFSSQYTLANSLSSVNELIPRYTDFSAPILNIKSGQPYDKTKDPALRRGTENWEQSQESFFVVPGIVFGIIAVFLFFNRNKSE